MHEPRLEGEFCIADASYDVWRWSRDENLTAVNMIDGVQYEPSMVEKVPETTHDCALRVPSKDDELRRNSQSDDVRWTVSAPSWLQRPRRVEWWIFAAILLALAFAQVVCVVLANFVVVFKFRKRASTLQINRTPVTPGAMEERTTEANTPVARVRRVSSRRKRRERMRFPAL